MDRTDYQLLKRNLSLDVALSWLAQDCKDDFYPDPINYSDIELYSENYLSHREHRFLQIFEGFLGLQDAFHSLVLLIRKGVCHLLKPRSTRWPLLLRVLEPRQPLSSTIGQLSSKIRGKSTVQPHIVVKNHGLPRCKGVDWMPLGALPLWFRETDT